MAGIGFNSFNNPYAKTTLKANVNAPLAKAVSNQPTVQRSTSYDCASDAADAGRQGNLEAGDTIRSKSGNTIKVNRADKDGAYVEINGYQVYRTYDEIATL